MPAPTKLRLTLPVLLTLAILSLAAQSQSAPPAEQKPDSKSVAEVDAGLGPCTADFIVNDDAGKPVYGAKIHVRVSYGFMSLHKLDLNVGNNADGKARFIGLPESSKQGGLFFRAYDGDGPTYREGSAFDNPEKTCKAQFTLVLRNKPQPAD